MTTKDVLALALEALAANEFHLVEMGKRGNGLQAQTVKAITAIKQAHQAQSVKIIEYRDQRIAPCGCHPDEACEQCCPELPKPQAQQAQEPVAWEATTPGYIKYVTDKQYRSYSETAKRWYKPYKCSSCAAPKQAEPFNPDWSLLDATQESLREHMQMVKQAEPVAWVLEWTFDGEEKGYRLYDDETHCKFDAEKDGGVCRPLVYGDAAPTPPEAA
jgi:hypothetical protein